MTKKYKAFIVTVEENIRQDDAEALIAALQMLKGVIKVSPIEATGEDAISEIRAKSQVAAKLSEFIRENLA